MLGSKVYVVALAVVCLSCRMAGEEESAAFTYQGVDDFLKVAVNHIGANCSNTGATADSSHHLNGSNGELMLEQAKRIDRGGYGFSGDAVMGRTEDNLKTTMADIEAKCRRLILSVDVSQDRHPHITFSRGSTVADPQSKFAADFGQNGYGEISCMGYGGAQPIFCSFANIQGKNGKVRWFAYLQPDAQDAGILQANVLIGDNIGNQHGSYPITLQGIYNQLPNTTNADATNASAAETSGGASSDQPVLELTDELTNYFNRHCKGIVSRNAKGSFTQLSSPITINGESYAASHSFRYTLDDRQPGSRYYYSVAFGGIASPDVVACMQRGSVSCSYNAHEHFRSIFIFGVNGRTEVVGADTKAIGLYVSSGVLKADVIEKDGSSQLGYTLASCL
ncbi:MAG: hypothetical protein OYH77_01335 [Pseudomonadota bacterium]|nr:hypothetical protein [Pseudomonadota bacterium]